LRRTQCRHGSQHLPARLGLFDRSIRFRSWGVGVFDRSGLGVFGAATVAPNQIDATMHCNRPQPRPQAFRVAQVGETFPGFHEYTLGDILSVMHMAQTAHGDTEEGVLVALDDRRVARDRLRARRPQGTRLRSFSSPSSGA
jgi:hypothetical protein